jgi:(2Fe-2S) ferredoxin
MNGRMHYKKHVFLCTNQKPTGKPCCANAGGSPFFVYAKEQLNAMGLHGEGNIRMSQSGCLGRCQQGPCLVIYPEAVWYTYASFADIDEIIASHLVLGNVVQRLLIDQDAVAT